MSKITRKQYNIERIEKVAYCYSVQASSKAEALRLVDEYEVSYEDMYCISSQKAKVVSIDVYDTCPNKGRAWTEVPLKQVDFSGEWPRVIDPTGKKSSWYYNGACKGEKNQNDAFCYHCRNAMRKGHRMTVPAENKHLNKSYHMGLIE